MYEQCPGTESAIFIGFMNANIWYQLYVKVWALNCGKIKLVKPGKNEHVEPNFIRTLVSSEIDLREWTIKIFPISVDVWKQKYLNGIDFYNQNVLGARLKPLTF